MTNRPPCKDLDLELTNPSHEWVWVAFRGWECAYCHKTATERRLAEARAGNLEKAE